MGSDVGVGSLVADGVLVGSVVVDGAELRAVVSSEVSEAGAAGFGPAIAGAVGAGGGTIGTTGGVPGLDSGFINCGRYCRDGAEAWARAALAGSGVATSSARVCE